MDSLDELREDLWNRWREALDRFADLDGASQSGERIVYANGELFDLKKYTPQKFPAGGRSFPKQPESINSYHRYWLDAKGRPVHAAFGHTVNHCDWEGFYQYSTEEVEYVEFCLQTKVVSQYVRMTLRNGIPRTYQKIRVNGLGSHVGGATGKAAMDRIFQDPFFHLIEIEEYEVSEGRTIGGKSLALWGSRIPYRFSLDYSYSHAGKLERIVAIREDGSKQTLFAARSKVSMKELAARLSEKIAARTIDALKKVELGAPLQAVELSFRSVTNYVPGLIPATARDNISDMNLVLATDQKSWVELNQEDFEPEMAEFLERMHTAEDWDPGSKMLRKASFLVTTLAPGSLTVADGFIAFAMDGEFEGHELPAILKQCGATSATLKKLRSIGWLA
jgi:hypothetical protein